MALLSLPTTRDQSIDVYVVPVVPSYCSFSSAPKIYLLPKVLQYADTFASFNPKPIHPRGSMLRILSSIHAELVHHATTYRPFYDTVIFP